MRVDAILSNLNLDANIYELESNYQGNILHVMREDALAYSFGGNKVRIAIELFEDLKRKNCDCIISYGGRGSNLNRVIANMAFNQRIPCYVIVSETEGDQFFESINDKMVRLSHAKVINCKKKDVLKTVVQVFEMCNQKGLRYYYIYGNAEGVGNESVHVAAYHKVYKQILAYEANNNIRFDYIFLASGTGMTQAGLVSGMIDAADEKTIVGISVSKSKMAGEMSITRGVEQFFPDKRINFSDMIHFEDRYNCGGYGCYNDEINRTIIDILVRYGIPLDRTYTGKAFWGMNAYLENKSIAGKHILFIHTGGTPLFFDDFYGCVR